MDLITYALLKKKIDEKVAVLDAGMTSAMSLKNGQEQVDITTKVWDSLNDETVDVFAMLDGVMIKAEYIVIPNGVEINDGLGNLICTVREGEDGYEVTWGTAYSDVDISIAQSGVIGGGGSAAESNWINGEGSRAVKQIGATSAVGTDAVAQGRNTQAGGLAAHAEGNATDASGDHSHAEGNETSVGVYAIGGHAEGYSTSVTGQYGHAEGYNTDSRGNYAHTEGKDTSATAEGAHAEGLGTVVGGNYAHAEGYYTTANRDAQHVFGQYNIVDTYSNQQDNKGKYVEIVGNGTAQNSRRNARTLDWEGNEEISGSLSVGGGIVLSKGNNDETILNAGVINNITDQLDYLEEDVTDLTSKVDSVATYTIVNNAISGLEIDGESATVNDLVRNDDVKRLEVTDGGTTYIFGLVESGDNRVYVCNYANSNAAVIPLLNDETSLIPTWYDKYARIYVQYSEGAGQATILNSDVAEILLATAIPTMVVLTYENDATEKEHYLYRVQENPKYNTLAGGGYQKRATYTSFEPIDNTQNILCRSIVIVRDNDEIAYPVYTEHINYGNGFTKELYGDGTDLFYDEEHTQEVSASELLEMFNDSMVTVNISNGTDEDYIAHVIGVNSDGGAIVINNPNGGSGSDSSSSFTTQLETSVGLTLGKGTEDETSLTAAELAAMKNAGDIPPTPFIIASSNNPELTIPANSVVSFQVTGIIELARGFYAEFHRKYGDDYGVIFCVELSGSTQDIFDSLAFDVSMMTTGIVSVVVSVSDNIPDLYIRVKNFTAASVTLNSSRFGYNVFAIPFCKNLAVE